MNEAPGRLLGRERELAAAAEAIAAVKDGGSRVLAVLGETGIGKSALLDAVRTRTEESGMLVLDGRAAEHERDVPFGLVIVSARSYTSAHQEAIDTWNEADVPVWGSIPERVSIASGPEAWLSEDGLESYRGVWRRALRAARGF